MRHHRITFNWTRLAAAFIDIAKDVTPLTSFSRSQRDRAFEDFHRRCVRARCHRLRRPEYTRPSQ
ncbi:hypothetical protein MESS4_560030 [Mesorhizobium sp. STM 4661]|nr:hypothetical protein MESS4_560030 [Mesorhizobium sp. STM 4661]